MGLEAVLFQHLGRLGGGAEICHRLALEPHPLVELGQQRRLARPGRPLDGRLTRSSDSSRPVTARHCSSLKRLPPSSDGSSSLAAPTDGRQRATPARREPGDVILLGLQRLGGRHAAAVNLLDEDAVPWQLGVDLPQRDRAQAVQQGHALHSRSGTTEY